MLFLLIYILLFSFIALLVLVFKFQEKYIDQKEKFDKLCEKYSPIINVDKELSTRKSELKIIEKSITEAEKSLKSVNEICINLNKDKEKLDHDITLRENYKTIKEDYDNLTELKKSLEEDIDIIECGLYKPHFDFETSERYKIAINKNYEQQKLLIKKNEATVSDKQCLVKSLHS